jgi:hypothetical protein
MVPRALRGCMLAGCVLLAAACTDEAPLVLVDRGTLQGVGSARLDLPLGTLRGGTGTLVLSGEPSFESQTRQLQLTGPDAQRSVFFGSLPAGVSYRLELLAGDCRGEASFSVEANRTTQVVLQLSCASPAAQLPTSSMLPSPATPDAPAPPANDPDCALIAEIVAQPPVQRGNGETSTIELVLRAGVKSSAVEWALMEASSGVGLLFPSPTSALAVGFDCERDGVAGIVASVSGTRAGKACRQQGQTQVQCVEQGSAGVKPPAPPPPPSGPGACGACSRDYCGAQLAAVQALAAAEPVLSCVLGAGWSAGERASAESCGNTDLLGCYCGSTPELVCEQAAPAELDGPCLDELLSGSGCTDSSCVKASLLDPARPSGAALSYVRCQQDYCYDICFNL